MISCSRASEVAIPHLHRTVVRGTQKVEGKLQHEISSTDRPAGQCDPSGDGGCCGKEYVGYSYLGVSNGGGL